MTMIQTAPVYRAGTSDKEIEAAAALAVKKRKSQVLFWQLAILFIALALWEFTARTGQVLDHWYGVIADAPDVSILEFRGRNPIGAHHSLIDPFFFSYPTQILGRLWEWMTEGTSEGPLWFHLWITMYEALWGFVTGSVFGIITGIALGRNRFASDVFSVYIKVANSIPRVVLAPIFIMLFGLGLWSKVALSFVMVFFVVFANAFQGVVEADRAMIANAQILGASRWDVTRHVVLPSAMSWIFASLHVSFGFAIVGAIVGEFVGARYGIGQLINIARGSFDAGGMYAAILLIMIVALLAEFLMTAIENQLVKWRPKPLNETN